MIIITGSVTLRPEHLGSGMAECIAHSRRSRAEPGCLSHNCHVDCENPTRVVFVERWADMAAVQAHFAVPASGAFVKALRELAAAPPEMTIYEASAVG